MFKWFYHHLYYLGAILCNFEEDFIWGCMLLHVANIMCNAIHFTFGC